MQELEKILEEIEDHVKKFVVYGTPYDYISFRWVKQIIRKHMNDGWIPVDKDSVPQNEILACNRYGNELIGYLIYDSNAEEFVCESDECIMYQVTAWMEKPEPYRPERRI